MSRSARIRGALAKLEAPTPVQESTETLVQRLRSQSPGFENADQARQLPRVSMQYWLRFKSQERVTSNLTNTGWIYITSVTIRRDPYPLWYEIWLHPKTRQPHAQFVC